MNRSGDIVCPHYVMMIGLKYTYYVLTNAFLVSRRITEVEMCLGI